MGDESQFNFPTCLVLFLSYPAYVLACIIAQTYDFVKWFCYFQTCAKSLVRVKALGHTAVEQTACPKSHSEPAWKRLPGATLHMPCYLF